MMEQNEIKLKSTGPKNSDSCFCIVFSGYGQSVISGKEAGH